MAFTWSIHEPLNLHWDHEHLFLDVPEGEAAAREVRAVTDGERAFAAQYDPERNALAVCLDVAPGQELALTASQDSPEGPTVDVEHRFNCVVFRNQHCAVAFPREVQVQDRGEEWIVTGPVAWVEGPDGLPRAASRLVIAKSQFFPHDRQNLARVSPAKLAAEETAPTAETEVPAEGPLFARYRYRLTLFDGSEYRFTATLWADWPAVLIEEETALGREGNIELLLSEDFPCDEYFFGGADNNSRQRVVPIPSHACCLGSLAPHHTQSQNFFAWLGFAQSDRPQGSFRGILETALQPYADALVVFAHQPWYWLYPSEITLRFEVEEGGRVVIRGPLRRGLRRWLLFIMDRREALRTSRFQYHDEVREVSPFALWHRRVNDLPFDWVRRLDLTSGALDPAKLPRTLLTQEEWRAARAGVFPELARRMQEQISGTSTHALYARWALTGDREALRLLAPAVIADTEAKLALFYHSGFLSDAASAVSLRVLGPTAVHYEACVAEGLLTPEQAERLRTLMLLFAHCTAEDALFPSRLNYLPPDDPHSIRNWATEAQYSDLFGTPNFQTDVYYNLGLYGAVFAEHPRARQWLEEAARQLDAQLDFHFHPGGVYEESILYFAHLFHNMLSLASVLKRQGVRDFYADPRFQAAMECFVDYLGAPRRPTIERMAGRLDPASGQGQLLRFWPAIGDTGGDSVEATIEPLTAHAAREVRPHNPALADRLLAAWQAGGGRLWGLYGPQFEYLYIEDPEPPTAPLTLASRNFANVGQMLRADVGLPSETSLFFRSGRATHHWGFDHGHFTLTTRGSLLLPDYGYHGRDHDTGEPVHGSATWLHNVVTFGPHWNGGTGMERRAAERTIQIGEQFDYVVADLCMNNVRVGAWRNIQPIIPIEYYRHLLFAHNRYFLVWDRIEFGVYRSQLRIHCLARSVSREGPRLRFQGLDDVDLVVHLLAPAEAATHEGLVGFQRYVLLEQDCQRDYLWLGQPLGPDESEFEVLSSPHLITVRGTDLHGAEFEDHIVYAKGDFGAQVEIEGVCYRLEGRLALLHREEGREETHLFDAASLQPIK